MSTPLVRTIGNQLYKFAFPLYRPVYSLFKAYEDRSERELLKRLVKPGEIVVDAGGNIGIYAEFLSALVGPTGEVHSFEPCPNNFERLSQSTSRLGNVRANHAAVGATSEAGYLYVSKDLNVDHRAWPTEGEHREKVPMRSVALDDYFKPEQTITLLKMDIQGYEYKALLGAERLIARSPQIRLFLEYWPFGLRNAGVEPQDLLELLKRWGFKLYGIEPQGLVPFDPSGLRFALDSYTNLLAQRE